MQLKTRALLTKSLIIISIVAGVLSLYTIKKGAGELYPFFHWKLYTQPLGTTGEFTEYRIYSKNGGESSFKRNNIKALENFNHEEFVYTLNFLVGRTLDPEYSNVYKKKLEAFVKYSIPQAERYKIVAETYRPKDIIKNSLNYDTTTVISF